jgi:hypothetical protein
MSSWNGISDGDSDGNIPESPIRSPFSAAFNTPRPPGILTNGQVTLARKGGFSAVAQVAVRQLAVRAIKPACPVLSTVTSAPASVPTKPLARLIPRWLSSTTPRTTRWKNRLSDVMRLALRLSFFSFFSSFLWWYCT